MDDDVGVFDQPRPHQPTASLCLPCIASSRIAPVRDSCHAKVIRCLVDSSTDETDNFDKISVQQEGRFVAGDRFCLSENTWKSEGECRNILMFMCR